MREMNEPLVSIRLITFNHEQYLHLALDGILMQKVDFQYEIVIGDDFSTDSTPKIIQQYKEKYPEIIRVMEYEEKPGRVKNFIETFNACKGSYIALLDGDDYWSDSSKLQVMIDTFQRNPNATIVFHAMKVEKNGQFHKDYILNDFFEKVSVLDLAKGNFIRTSACVYRVQDPRLPQNFEKSFVLDYFLHMHYVKHGDIIYVPIELGVYRVHANSVWSSEKKEVIQKRWLDMLELIIPQHNGMILEILKTQYSEVAFSIFTKLRDQNKIEEARLFFDKAINMDQAFFLRLSDSKSTLDLKSEAAPKMGVWKRIISKLINTK